MTSIKRSMTLSLACGALLALALGSVAFATHARPGGGTPFRAPLVVAYNQCGGTPTTEDPAPSATTNTHVTPLAVPSCSPQVRKSTTLTWTANGTGQGVVRLDVICTDGQLPPCSSTTQGTNPPGAGEEDVRISSSSIAAVGCQVAGTGPPQPPFPTNTCSAPGAAYTGVLLAQSVIRITDHSNAAPPNDYCTVGTGAAPCVTGTSSDLTFTVPMVCGGGNCSPAASTINGLLPGAVKELQRGNVEIANIRVKSPGPDFTFGPPPFPGTPDDEKFLTQGIFLP